MTPPTLQQPQPFKVIFRSNYKRPWIVKHVPTEQFVRFCKTAAAAAKIAQELNCPALARPLTDEQV